MITIRTRLTYQFVFLVTLVLVSFSVGVYFFSSLYLQKRYFKRLQDRALTTATVLFELKQPNEAVRRLMTAPHQEPLLNENISVYSEASKEFLFSTNPVNIALHEQLVSQLKPGMSTTQLTKGAYQLVAIHLKGPKGGNWILVSGIDQAGGEALADLKRILVVMILAAILLLGVSGWLFADRALAPMAGIIQQVNAIFPDNVTKRVEHPNRSDEIGALVATFNQLLDRIEQAFHAQKIFIANVSHELKNPLTKMGSQIDVALLQKRNADVYEQTLQSLQEDSRLLTQLTNTLLELANTTLEANQLPFESVRMDELLWEAKTQLQQWNPEYQILVTFTEVQDEEEALLTLGNRDALKILLSNLMDNACKFSPTKTARVNLQPQASTLLITVENEGDPIPEADLPYIFQPFFRSNATARSHKGHGIGLAIASQITQIHRSTITVNSTAEKTAIVLTLPNLKAI